MKKIALTLVSILILSIFCGCISDDNNSNDSTVFIDSDNDGIHDGEDAFPDDPAASVDSDGDGYPDEWNPGKNQDDSTSSPPLELDDLDHDPDEWKDSDGDGVGDNTDVFPNDSNEWSDLDNDGIGDNSDKNPSVNLSISVSIEKFEVTKNFDFFRRAQVYFDIIIDEVTNRYDNNGRYWRVWVDEEQSVSKVSFDYDIPDDTNDDYTDISIIMYDYNFLRNDRIIDINLDSQNEILQLKYDNVANRITYDGTIYGSEATVWFEISSAESNVPDTRTIDKTYNWKYDNKDWEISISIPTKTYENYLALLEDRTPLTADARARFVTSEEKVIKDLAAELKSLANNQNYNSKETVNFILSFVQDQGNIKYLEDNETKGCNEYWRYPVETLVDQTGDCEDTTVLFASIIDELEYDVVLLLYIWDQDGEDLGHLAGGVHLSGSNGHYVKDSNGKKYYYCETTASDFKIGELPKNPLELAEDPHQVIHV